MEVAMETETDMVVKRLSVPIGLEELMESLTKEVLRRKPPDIYAFASEHFAQLLEIRDQGNIKGSLKRNRQNCLQTSRVTADSKEGKSNPIKVKTATFGAMTRTTNKTTMRNKSPAPKSFISKKNATVSKVSPRTQSSNNKTNKQDRNKLILEKRKVSKRNMEDARKKLESEGQPVELESKRIDDVLKRSDVTKRRQSIVQKKNAEKDSVEKPRSRSTSKSKQEDAKSTTERFRRKSDVSKGIKKGSDIAKLTSNAEVGELNTQKVITQEKISPRNKEGKRRMSREGKKSRITPSNIEISDEIVTQMGRHNLKGKDQVPIILDTSKREQLDTEIFHAIPTEAQLSKVEEISAIEVKETEPNQKSPQLTTNQELCSAGLHISFDPGQNIAEKTDSIEKNIDGENATCHHPTHTGFNENNSIFEEDVLQSDRDKTDEIIESDIKNIEQQDLTPAVENGKQSDNNDKKTLDAFKAAVKIQSLIRGYIVRKSIPMKKSTSSRDQDKFQEGVNILSQDRKLDEKILAMEEDVILTEMSNAEKETDEREKAAVKIQSMVRGHLCRKNLNMGKDIKDKEGTSSEIGKKGITKEEIKNVDIEEHFIGRVKEIVKIQALVRGRLLRRSLVKNATPRIEIYALEKEEVNEINKLNVKDENLSISELDLESEASNEISDVTNNQESKIVLNREKFVVLGNNQETIEETSGVRDSADRKEFLSQDGKMEVGKAVTIIQGLARGYLVRKRLKKRSVEEGDAKNVYFEKLTEHLPDVNNETRYQIWPTEKKDILNDDDSDTYQKESIASFIEQEQIHYDSNRYDYPLVATNYTSLEISGIKPNHQEESERDQEKESKEIIIKFDMNDGFGDNVKPRANSIEKIADAPNYVNDAATKIQSAWRWHRIRKSVKPIKLGDLQAPQECDELPHQRGISEDARKAAIIIQALFRGYMTRKRYENAEHRSLKKKGFEGSLPTLLEVEGEDSKHSTVSSDHERIDESSDVLSNTESSHILEGDASLSNLDASISEKSKTISDEEVFTALKQLDDAPIPMEEPRRKSKTFTRSLTFDDPSIHQGNNVLMKSTTFVMGDEFQKFDSENGYASLRSTETDDESLCTESESKLIDETNDISEITTSIKEDVQKLKKTLENGVEAEKTFENEHNDGNITEITKSISEQVRELEKALNQDSVSNLILSGRDSAKNIVEDISESTEFSTRPVSKDSVTSTDSVDTVIFNEMKEGIVRKVPLDRFSTKSDFNSSSSGEYNEANLSAIKEQGDILVNDILNTAKNKLEDRDTEKQFFEREPVLQLTTDKRQSTTSDELRQLWQDEAATTIQKNYRGYRVRRDLEEQQNSTKDIMEKEKCVDREITRYLNQITEPIRRTFSADKSFISEPGKNREIKQRVHSASEVIPDIIYIPLRDYSSEEQEIQVTPIENVENLETNNNDEIIKDEEIIKRKEHQAVLLSPHETDDASELLDVPVDKVDKSVDDKISACISSIVEPLTKHFQPIESIHEKEDVEVSAEESEPVYQYIPLRNYSEDENKENESLPVLNDNITTTMSILKEHFEENEGEEISANEEFAEIDDSNQSTSDTIVNEKSPDNFLYEHFTPGEVVRENNVAGENIFTATTQQVAIHPSVEYGSKEINEYISSIIEPAKTSPILSKRESLPIKESALRDYKDIASNDKETKQIRSDKEDIDNIIKGEIMPEHEVIGKEKEVINTNKVSVNQESKEESASNVTHPSIGDEVKEELQSNNSVVLDSTETHLGNITESEILKSKQAIDNAPSSLGGEGEINQEKLLQTVINDNIEIFSQPEKAEIASEFRKTANIVKNIQNLKEIAERETSELTNKQPEPIDEIKELILVANKELGNSNEISDKCLAKEDEDKEDVTAAKSVEENETSVTDTKLEVCKIEKNDLLKKDEADIISNEEESAKDDYIEHTEETGENKLDVKIVEDKIIRDTTDTSDQISDTVTEISDIKVASNNDSQFDETRDAEENIKATVDVQKQTASIKRPEHSDTLNSDESEIAFSVESDILHEDSTETDQRTTNDNLNLELSNSLSDSTDNSVDVIRVEIRDKLHGADVLHDIQEDNTALNEVLENVSVESDSKQHDLPNLSDSDGTTESRVNNEQAMNDLQKEIIPQESVEGNTETASKQIEIAGPGINGLEVEIPNNSIDFRLLTNAQINKEESKPMTELSPSEPQFGQEMDSIGDQELQNKMEIIESEIEDVLGRISSAALNKRGTSTDESANNEIVGSKSLHSGIDSNVLNEETVTRNEKDTLSKADDDDERSGTKPTQDTESCDVNTLDYSHKNEAEVDENIYNERHAEEVVDNINYDSNLVKQITAEDNITDETGSDIHDKKVTLKPDNIKKMREDISAEQQTKVTNDSLGEDQMVSEPSYSEDIEQDKDKNLAELRTLQDIGNMGYVSNKENVEEGSLNSDNGTTATQKEMKQKDIENMSTDETITDFPVAYKNEGKIMATDVAKEIGPSAVIESTNEIEDVQKNASKLEQVKDIDSPSEALVINNTSTGFVYESKAEEGPHLQFVKTDPSAGADVLKSGKDEFFKLNDLDDNTELSKYSENFPLKDTGVIDAIESKKEADIEQPNKDRAIDVTNDAKQDTEQLNKGVEHRTQATESENITQQHIEQSNKVVKCNAQEPDALENKNKVNTEQSNKDVDYGTEATVALENIKQTNTKESNEGVKQNTQPAEITEPIKQAGTEESSKVVKYDVQVADATENIRRPDTDQSNKDVEHDTQPIDVTENIKETDIEQLGKDVEYHAEPTDFVANNTHANNEQSSEDIKHNTQPVDTAKNITQASTEQSNKIVAYNHESTDVAENIKGAEQSNEDAKHEIRTTDTTENIKQTTTEQSNLDVQHISQPTENITEAGTEQSNADVEDNSGPTNIASNIKHADIEQSNLDLERDTQPTYVTESISESTEQPNKDIEYDSECIAEDIKHANSEHLNKDVKYEIQPTDETGNIKQTSTVQSSKDIEHYAQPTDVGENIKQIDAEQSNKEVECDTYSSEATENIKRADVEHSNEEVERQPTDENIMQASTEKSNKNVQPDAQRTGVIENIKQINIEQPNEDVEYDSQSAGVTENLKQEDTEQSSGDVVHDNQLTDTTEHIKQAASEQSNINVEHDTRPAEEPDNVKQVNIEQLNEDVEHDKQHVTEDMKQADTERLSGDVEHDYQLTHATESIKQAATNESNKDVEHVTRLAEVTENVEEVNTEQSNEDVEHDTQTTGVTENMKQGDIEQSNGNMEQDHHLLSTTENIKQAATDQSNKDVEHDTQPAEVTENVEEVNTEQSNKDVEHDTQPADTTENIKQAATDQSNKDVEHDIQPAEVTENVEQVNTEQSSEDVEHATQTTGVTENMKQGDIEQSNGNMEQDHHLLSTTENITQAAIDQSNNYVQHDTRPAEVTENVEEVNTEQSNEDVEHDTQPADTTENIKQAATDQSNKDVEHDTQPAEVTENVEEVNTEQSNEDVDHDIQPAGVTENMKQADTEQSQGNMEQDYHLLGTTENLNQAATNESNKDVEHVTRVAGVTENVEQVNTEQSNEDVQHVTQPAGVPENTKQADNEQSNGNMERDYHLSGTTENIKQATTDQSNKDVEHDTQLAEVTENVEQINTERSNEDVQRDIQPAGVTENMKQADIEQSSGNMEHDYRLTGTTENIKQAVTDQSNKDVEHDTQIAEITENVEQVNTEQSNKDVEHDTHPAGVTENMKQADIEQSSGNMEHDYRLTGTNENIKQATTDQSNKDVEHVTQLAEVTENVEQVNTEPSNEDVEHVTQPAGVTENMKQADNEQSSGNMEHDYRLTGTTENIKQAATNESNKDVKDVIRLAEVTENVEQVNTEQSNEDVQNVTQPASVTESTKQADNEQSTGNMEHDYHLSGTTENIKQAATDQSNKDVEHDTQLAEVTENVKEINTEHSNEDVAHDTQLAGVTENMRQADIGQSKGNMKHDYHLTGTTENIKQAVTDQSNKDVEHDTQIAEITENVEQVNIEQSNKDVEHDIQPAGVIENMKQAVIEQSNGVMKHDYRLTDATENIKQAGTDQLSKEVEYDTHPAEIAENVTQVNTQQLNEDVKHDTQLAGVTEDMKQVDIEQSNRNIEHDYRLADSTNNVKQAATEQSNKDVELDTQLVDVTKNVNQEDSEDSINFVQSDTQPIEVIKNAAKGITNSESTKLNVGSDKDDDQVDENKKIVDVGSNTHLTKVEDSELSESKPSNEPIPIVGNSNNESEDAKSFSGFTDELQKHEGYNTTSDTKCEDKNYQDRVISDATNPALIESDSEENLPSEQEKIEGSKMLSTKNEVYEEEPEEAITRSDELELGGTKQASPFYLHQDSFIQDSSSGIQEKKFSEALRANADSTKENDSVATTERLLHSSEFHDSIPINVTTETPQKPLPTQTNGVQCNIGSERSASTSTVLVHSGELHDNILPLALQMNQDPGIEIVTSPNKHQTSVADAQASNKDVSARLRRLDKARVQSESGGNPSSMDTEKRNNSTLVKKNMESEAATKIQASFRGYQVRKQLKNKLARDNITNIKRITRRRSLGRILETKSANKQPSDLEEQSATKIQAGIRGFLVRRRQKKTKTSAE